VFEISATGTWTQLRHVRQQYSEKFQTVLVYNLLQYQIWAMLKFCQCISFQLTSSDVYWMCSLRLRAPSCSFIADKSLLLEGWLNSLSHCVQGSLCLPAYSYRNYLKIVNKISLYGLVSGDVWRTWLSHKVTQMLRNKHISISSKLSDRSIQIVVTKIYWI
jgi:hypothetical protein